MRGPPGEGFRQTPEGDYDITNKRLCHVAPPMDVHDAINLDYVEDLIQTVSTHNQMQRRLANLRQSMERILANLENMLANLKSERTEKLQQQSTDLDMTHSLTLRHAELIKAVDVKVNGSHVRDGETSSGGGAPQTSPTFPRRQVEIRDLDDTWSADLIDMSSYAKVNKNHHFILVVIDNFSKYAWAIPTRERKKWAQFFLFLVLTRSHFFLVFVSNCALEDFSQ